MKLLLTIIYLICTTSGMVLFKLGGNTLSLNFKSSLNFKIGYLTLLGLLMYVVSFLLWQKLLLMFDLTYIVPITTGVIQILVLIIGIFVFKEKVDMLGIAGIFTVILGIILIALGKK